MGFAILFIESFHVVHFDRPCLTFAEVMGHFSTSPCVWIWTKWFLVVLSSAFSSFNLSSAVGEMSSAFKFKAVSIKCTIYISVFTGIVSSLSVSLAFVCLLGFYMLATSEVICGWASTCDSTHSHTHSDIRIHTHKHSFTHIYTFTHTDTQALSHTHLPTHFYTHM